MSQAKISKTTTILGFFVSFAAGVAGMRGIDTSGPRGASGDAQVHREGSAVSAREVKPGAVRVDLHVMSQCPYGVQAEAAFKDVVAKFGPDLDLNVEYIGQTAPSG